MAKIFWLASYPKSGNTWLRILLSNLLSGTDEPININQMETHGIASSKQIFEQELGTDAAELSDEEINLVRPDIYCSHVQKKDHDLYIKVHDAYQHNHKQQAFFPNRCSGGALYIVRHPFDVAVSLANHLGSSLEVAVDAMINPEYAFCAKSNRGHDQIKQQLFSWSQHIQSWQQAEMPVHQVRYEDMLADTATSFRQIVDFIGLQASQAEIESAVAFSNIKELQKQEQAFGFKEKPTKAKQFFRKGDSGDGKKKLTDVQQHKLTEALRPMMETLDYL